MGSGAPKVFVAFSIKFINLTNPSSMFTGLKIIHKIGTMQPKCHNYKKRRNTVQ